MTVDAPAAVSRRKRRLLLCLTLAGAVVAIAAIVGGWVVCGFGKGSGRGGTRTRTEEEDKEAASVRLSSLTAAAAARASPTSEPPPSSTNTTGYNDGATFHTSNATSTPVAHQATSAPNATSMSTNAATTRGPMILATTTSTRWDGSSGALVTSACLFRDYPYAVDIFWSCGDERFGEPLRLHTFKRHSRGHRRIFADQRITYRNSQLWFDGYGTPRCVAVSGNGDDGDGSPTLVLRTRDDQCASFAFTDRDTVQDMSTKLCVGLGDGTTCDDDRSTGGRECGGIDHRYLPLGMRDCASGLVFRFETEAEGCTNGREERPESLCF